jgi:hypothetical protein
LLILKAAKDYEEYLKKLRKDVEKESLKEKHKVGSKVIFIYSTDVYTQTHMQP